MGEHTKISGITSVKDNARCLYIDYIISSHLLKGYRSESNIQDFSHIPIFVYLSDSSQLLYVWACTGCHFNSECYLNPVISRKENYWIKKQKEIKKTLMFSSVFL